MPDRRYKKWRKKRLNGNPEPYSVSVEKQCGAQKADGQPCKAPKWKGTERCIHHGAGYVPPPPVETLLQPTPIQKALIDRELNTIDDVRKFLSELIMAFKNNSCTAGEANTMANLCKQIIAAIKERDAQSPEGQERAIRQIHEVVKAARALSPEAARQVLWDRNFRVLELSIDAEIQQVESMAEEIVHVGRTADDQETLTEGAGGTDRAGDEGQADGNQGGDGET